MPRSPLKLAILGADRSMVANENQLEMSVMNQPLVGTKLGLSQPLGWLQSDRHDSIGGNRNVTMPRSQIRCRKGASTIYSPILNPELISTTLLAKHVKPEGTYGIFINRPCFVSN